MVEPQVPIDVDPETGVWTSDGLPMVYVPRHFLVNNHRAIEDHIGAEAYREILFDSGYQSAYDWCERAAEVHGLSAWRAAEFYLSRLSQRGWGLFEFEGGANVEQTRIRLEHSVFALAYGAAAKRKVCYMFEGWFAGALEYVARQNASNIELDCTETQCAADGIHNECIFTVRRM